MSRTRSIPNSEIIFCLRQGITKTETKQSQNTHVSNTRKEIKDKDLLYYKWDGPETRMSRKEINRLVAKYRNRAVLFYVSVQ